MRGQRLLASLLLLTSFVTLGAGCNNSKADTAATKPVVLKIWRVFDEDNTFQEILTAYQTLHPNVSFEYRTLRYEEYEDELVKAFAEGTGPDIFSIHNTWIGGYENLISPMPPTVTIPYTETKGTIKKETVTTLKEEPTLSIRQLKTDYVDAVAADVVRPYQPNPKEASSDRIWGLPLSVDTLALYYNKDLFNAASIAEPPADWATFQADVAKLTTLSGANTVVQSGAAIGTSENVERAFDILSLLMMQNGTTMVDERGRSQFATENAARILPGAEAVRFYTDFANPMKEVYSWNADQPSSFDAFAAGKTAMFLGYAYHLPLLETRAPKLHYAIAHVPQIEGAKVVNYANYWVETVAKSTPNANWAWDFIEFAASPDHVPSYLTAAQKPTALRALISGQLEDGTLSVFASQLLTAKSWYTGTEIAITEKAFLDLIDAAVSGEPAEEALSTAENKVNQTL